jgi:ABC-type Na+ efflux pump permease subunit
MSQPLRNPFYVLLLAACGMLLLTILVYLVGWYHWSNNAMGVESAGTPPLPEWMKWVDRNAIYLLAGEVGAILLFSILTIGLDRFFERVRDAESDRR